MRCEVGEALILILLLILEFITAKAQRGAKFFINFLCILRVFAVKKIKVEGIREAEWSRGHTKTIAAGARAKPRALRNSPNTSPPPPVPPVLLPKARVVPQVDQAIDAITGADAVCTSRIRLIREAVSQSNA